MYIKQVVNNNVVVALDGSNQDIIVVAKGIGWKQKSNSIVDESLYADIKKYILDDVEITKIRQIYNQIPQDIFDLANSLVAKGMTGGENSNFVGITTVLMLSDHIFETIKRLKEGIYLNNVLTNEIKTFYKPEYEIAETTKDVLLQNYNVLLNEDEIAFIAIHLINLNLKNINETMQSIQIVDELVDIIRRILNVELKKNTYIYSRFITHLKYFSLRVIKKESIKTAYDEKLESFVKTNYAVPFHCAEMMKKYILSKYNYEISSNELIYLTIHLQNILNS